MSDFVGKGYMGQVTDRDVEMVNLLIREPSLSLDELGARLGITKQAVAERRSKLEEGGFTRSFYFWNVTPRFECTKRIIIGDEQDLGDIDSITGILDKFNPVVVFFRAEPEEFFRGNASTLTETISKIEGILLFNDEKEEEQLVSELGKLGITNVSIEPVLFSRLLGENCDIAPKSPEQVEEMAEKIARKMSSEASVQAVLFERPEGNVDQFDLLVIRDERFQPETDSYERRIGQTLLDYHFTNLRWFMKRKSKWIKNMKIVYAQDEQLRRKIRRKIDSI